MNSSGKAQEHLRHNDVYFEIDGLPDDDWFYWETGDCYVERQCSNVTDAYDDELAVISHAGKYLLEAGKSVDEGKVDRSIDQAVIAVSLLNYVQHERVRQAGVSD